MQIASRNHPRTVLRCPFWDPSHPSLQGYLRDVPGLSGIIQTTSHTHLQGCLRAVSGCPSWDPPDTKSQNCPGTSLVGSSRHQVTPAYWDVPGLSWDIPCGILQTSCRLGCPRGVLLQDHPLSSGQSQTSHYVWTVLGHVQHL